MMRLGAEKPRTVSPSPGRLTMREPLATNVQLSELSTESGAAGSSAVRNWPTFLNNSPLCRRLGLTSSINDFGLNNAVCKASSAAVVDLPPCLVMFSRMRGEPVRRKSTCQGSGMKPSLRPANSAGSNAQARSRAACRTAGSATGRQLLERQGDRLPGLRVGLQRAHHRHLDFAHDRHGHERRVLQLARELVLQLEAG